MSLRDVVSLFPIVPGLSSQKESPSELPQMADHDVLQIGRVRSLDRKPIPWLRFSVKMPGMTRSREKVVVAMSGGVDSSVAACLLAEQGYEVVGLFMRVGAKEVTEPRSDEATKPRSDEATERRSDGETEARRHEGADCRLAIGDGRMSEGGSRQDSGAVSYPIVESSYIDASRGLKSAARARQGCCSASDAGDARFVAGMLGVPFYSLNFEKEFDRIIDYFADEYARGRTPNPCVVCNDKLKFGRLFEYADAVGAKYVATGHYARIGRRDGRPVLMRGVDRRKDQSYVLFGLRREALERVMFPIGEMTKDEVRRIAARFGLPNCDKPDSVEICFAPDRDYARVVRERRPDAFAHGEVVDSDGSVIGRHEGIANFTIGQRRGLRIAAGKPIYVTQLDVLNNRVVMGDGEALLAEGLIAERVNLHAVETGEVFRADVKIRYLHEAVPATVSLLDDGRARVTFDDPQRAVTPGQAVVFYEGDVVRGGGWIEYAVASSRQPANSEC